MDSRLWKKVDSLLQAALERPPEGRDAFLRQACAGDQALEREVRSLLASQQKAGGFLESPAMEVAARALAIQNDNDAQRAADPLIGQTIAHYRIVGKLGAGGMGVVYKATDEKLHRNVALKCLRTEDSTAAERSRFLQEARAASALDHPNIGVIHGIEELDDGRLFIVMAYYEGETLAERLKRTPLDATAGADIVRQTAQALAEAHSKGIVHRDVKPSNIMITRPGLVKLLDFGLAKLGNAETLTRSRTTMGTAAYMSPEQALGRDVDRRTDIWALGVVLYEVLSGRRPFQRDSVPSTLLAVTQYSPPPLEGVPPDLQAAVDRCLVKDLEQRYQSARDLIRDLEPVSHSGDEPSITPLGEIGPDWARVATAPATGNTKPQATPDIAKRWKLMVPAAAAVLVLSAAGYFYFHRSPKLTDRDTIVLADFENKTGDPVFDDTLRQGLSVDLQQSPFLNLVSDAQVQRTLTLMGQPKLARLTPEIAQQACERTGSAAVLEGSIASLGSQYVLGLRAKDCNTGSILDQEQTVAARREDVLNSLSQIASKFRARVGESLATVEKHTTPLAEATTPSLEALKAYSTGMKVVVSSGGEAAIPLLRRAVEIDPQFAMPYAQLGVQYSNIGESLLSAESTTKAWQLRDRVSDREKFFIDFTYDRQVTGNLEKAYQTLELWYQTYPRGENPNAQGFLAGLATHGTGRYERAMEMSQKRIAANPEEVFGYSGLASSYFFLDRFAEAETTLQRASERKLETPDLLFLRYNIAVLRGDQEQIDRTAGLARGKPRAEHGIAHDEALALARSGRLQAARRSSSRAMDLALQAGDREVAASYQAARAVWEAVYGNIGEAKRNALAALALSKSRDVEYAAGLALAFSGDSTRSQPLADDLEKHFPEDTFARFTYVPVLRALSALDGKPIEAVEQLQTTLPYELAGNGLNFNHFYLGGLHSAYVRGEALMAAHKYAEAAVEFQKILDHRGIVGADPIGALAHLQLGRAFALSGDKNKAKTAYQNFLTLWKDADPDIPVLKQAKAEYTKLQ